MNKFGEFNYIYKLFNVFCATNPLVACMSKDDHVAQLAECSHGKRETLGSSPGRATIFSPCDIWWLSVGSRLGQRASKSGNLVVVPSRYADESN